MQARRVVRSVLFVVFSLIVLGLPGCDDSPPPLPPNSPGGGFFIETLFQPSPGVLQIAPNVTTIWEWLQDLGSAGGNASTFTNTTNGAGIGVAFNARTPAAWEVHWTRGGPPQCINASNFPGVRFDSFQDQVTNVICAQPVQFSLQSGATTSFSPNPLYTDGSSGDTAVVSGQGFSAQYGMPLLQYFDLNGNFVTQATATSLAADGSWIAAPVPDISQLGTGTYVGIVFNANPNGGYDYAASASVTVLPPPPPPPPGDPCPTNPCMPQN